MKKKSYILEENIKEVLARNVSIIYSKATKKEYSDVNRFVKYHLRTSKGVKSMISLAKKYANKLSGEVIKKLLLEIEVCSKLYFVSKGRG